MANGFDDILDRCIDRAREGDTMERCVAQYPEHAVELEPRLRTALRLAHAAAYIPTQQAKEQGRLRLRQEMDALAAQTSGRD